MRHGMLLNAMIRYGRKGEVTGLSLRYDVLLCGGGGGGSGDF